MKTNLSERMGENVKSLRSVLERHSPQISAGLAIFFFGYSVFKAVKVTPKANEEVALKKKELNTEKLPIKETAKIYGKNYILPAASFAAGTALVCNSVAESEKRYIAMTTSYELLREAARDYRSQVIETIGEKKEQKIRDAINQKEIDANQPVPSVNIYAPKEDGTHKALFYEPITNRYFWERREKVEIAIANAYKRQDLDDSLSVYGWISLLSDDISRNLPDGVLSKYMEIGWPRLTPSEGFHVEIVAGGTVHGGEYDGYPCLTFEYDELPTPDYKPWY